ncbi:MAG: polyketide synthase dehydratase domain-containing protein, partial [Proteobacteria bacterium]|nr:polyketide synthase dehydratase domain-containing protein [Pseudomonadota bacterium]
GSALPSQASLNAMNPYADYLFHGENLQMLLSIQSCQVEGLDARFLSKFGPQQWSTAASLGTQWMIQGEAVDAAFQAAIVWSRMQRDRPCLPAKIGRIECFAAIPQGELDLRLRIVRADQIQLIAEAEILDKSGQVLLRLEAIEAVMDPNLAAAFTLSQLPNHDQVLIDQASL